MQAQGRYEQMPPKPLKRVLIALIQLTVSVSAPTLVDQGPLVLLERCKLLALLLFCQPLNDSSESLIDLLLLPAQRV